MAYIWENLRQNPVIAAVREEAVLPRAVEAAPRVVFLLGGELGRMAAMVKLVRDAGKVVLMHLDLIEGLARDKAAVRYVAEKLKPDGIITTRGHLVRLAHGQDLFALQRIFVVDSVALQTGVSNLRSTGPDAVECLPAPMPRVLRRLVQQTGMPVIAGGLVRSREDLDEILDTGVAGVSVSREELW